MQGFSAHPHSSFFGLLSCQVFSVAKKVNFIQGRVEANCCDSLQDLMVNISEFVFLTCPPAIYQNLTC